MQYTIQNRGLGSVSIYRFKSSVNGRSAALRRISQIKKVILTESSNVSAPPADFIYELIIGPGSEICFYSGEGGGGEKMKLRCSKVPGLSCKNEQ